MNGYASPEYVRTLAPWGEPRHLPRSDGWLLERPIAGTDGWRDAMGPYPLFACRDWSRLGDDLRELGDLVSVTLVTDPFARATATDLRATFDHVRPFKPHIVVELGPAWSGGVSKHHRYEARRALRSLEVERVADPSALLDEWDALYATLASRHRLTGLKRFSRASFALQLQVPGIVMFVAREAGAIVGAHLWYLDGDAGYSHLQASSPRGYELHGAYALYWTALHELQGEIGVADIGAGAGGQAGDSGLDRFKSGWTAAAPVPVHVCGRTIDDRRYAALVETAGDAAATYYPAYRAGELT